MCTYGVVGLFIFSISDIEPHDDYFKQKKNGKKRIRPNRRPINGFSFVAHSINPMEIIPHLCISYRTTAVQL